MKKKHTGLTEVRKPTLVGAFLSLSYFRRIREGRATRKLIAHCFTTTQRGNGPAPHGRGVYVDAVQVAGPHGTIFDDRRPRDAALFRPDGWTPSRT